MIAVARVRQLEGDDRPLVLRELLLLPPDQHLNDLGPAARSALEQREKPAASISSIIAHLWSSGSRAAFQASIPRVSSLRKESSVSANSRYGSTKSSRTSDIFSPPAGSYTTLLRGGTAGPRPRLNSRRGRRSLFRWCFLGFRDAMNFRARDVMVIRRQAGWPSLNTDHPHDPAADQPRNRDILGMAPYVRPRLGSFAKISLPEPAAGRRAASAVAQGTALPVREGKVSPNGIRLPKKLPPPEWTWEEIQARKPLPEPPYLQSSPAVIPIDGALRAQTVSLLPWHRRSSYEPDAPARGVPVEPSLARRVSTLQGCETFLPG